MSGLIIKPANLDSDVETGQPILLGFLDLPSSIDNLKHDWYQRKAGFSPVKIRNMVRDMKAGDRMPSLVLGMRGDRFDAKDGAVVLEDPVYIIDGLQRWMAAVVAAEDGCVVKLSIQVFFNTTEEFEIALFRKLNSNRTNVAPSVHVRNERNVSRVAATLWGLSINEPTFALKDKVSWDQHFEPEVHLVSGMSLLNTLVALHRHILRFQHTTKALLVLSATDAQIDKVGLQQARENMIHFFDVIDELWDVRNATKKTGLIHLKQGFLMTLAKLMSDYTEFWRDDDNKQLFVPTHLIRDLKRLDPRDEEFSRLAGGNKAAREILYQLFVQRLNKGKVNKFIDRYLKEAMKEAAE